MGISDSTTNAAAVAAVTQTAPAVAKPRTAYLDVLICCAAFAVVLLHSNNLVHSFSPTLGWTQALLVECVFFWAVPIFFMASGINLMRYRDRYDTKTFFQKRGLKTLIPFVFWTLAAHVIFLVYNMVFYGGTVSLADFAPMELYRAVFLYPNMGLYWFFFTMFGIYLAMPVLSLLKDNKRVLWYFVAIGTVTFSVLPMLSKLFSIEYNTGLLFPLTGGGFIIYTILGYLLADLQIPKGWRIALYCSGIAALAFRFIYTYISSISADALNTTLFNYLFPTSMLLGVAVFVFFKQVDWSRLMKHRFFSKSVKLVSGCSLGIYLVHWFIIALVFPKLPYINWTLDRLVTRTLGAVVAFLLSLAIAWLLQKIPLVRKVVP